MKNIYTDLLTRFPEIFWLGDDSIHCIKQCMKIQRGSFPGSVVVLARVTQLCSVLCTCLQCVESHQKPGILQDAIVKCHNSFTSIWTFVSQIRISEDRQMQLVIDGHQIKALQGVPSITDAHFDYVQPYQPSNKLPQGSQICPLQIMQDLYLRETQYGGTQHTACSSGCCHSSGY